MCFVAIAEFSAGETQKNTRKQGCWEINFAIAVTMINPLHLMLLGKNFPAPGLRKNGMVPFEVPDLY